MLGAKDKKLLYLLDSDARQSLGSLAAQLRLSKRGVQYKMQRLEEQKILLGYRALINSSKIGFQYFRLLVSFYSLDEKTKEKFEKFVNESPYFAYVYRCQGGFDYACALWVRDLPELYKIANEIRFLFHGTVKEVREHLTLRIGHLQNRFLFYDNKFEEYVIGWPIENLKLDDLDKKILRSLAQDARVPLYSLALKFKEDSRKIAYRIRKLEESGVILAYRAVINYQALGFTYFKAFVTVDNASSSELNAIKQYVKQDPAIIFLNEGIGFSSLDISGIFLSIADFYSFMEKFKKRFPGKIGTHEMLIFGELVKYDYFPHSG